MNRHRDALKRARQAVKRRERNTSAISKIKTLRKKIDAAATPEARAVALQEFTGATAKAARKGILHKKTASRIVSRSAKKVAKK
jgi:small subunit ribosomal protein S20